jgi:hypothetical protein
VIIKFKDILPNPYRDLVHNPLREETIEDLRSSVRATGFWDNVSVRKAKQKGKFELGFGHHRIEAAKREGLTEANFIVQNWDESKMIKVKHDEDKARKSFDSATMIESVRAVVNALAAGAIPPFEVGTDTPKRYLRYAPSFVAGADVGRSPAQVYTSLHIAEFLGETKVKEGGRKKANDSVVTALDALALIEQQELSEASLKNVPLDNPSGDTKKMGLIQRVRVKKAQREVRLEATRTSEERAALDKAKHEQEEADKAKRAELLRQEREANKEKDAAEAKRLADEIKRQEEREVARQKAYKAQRDLLDAKIKEDNERAEQARKQDKDLPTRYAVKDMLRKLETIISERFAFREEVKTMSRDKAVTTNERELIRQAMIAAGDWYIDQANQFLPRPKVDVLKEAQLREEAKRKRGRTDEQE